MDDGGQRAQGACDRPIVAAIPSLRLLPSARNVTDSLATAVTLSLKNSSRVKLGEDDLRRAQAVATETRDAYVPSHRQWSAGESYGITLNVPTVFTINTQSLLYSSAQRFYLRASKLSVQAAMLDTLYNDVITLQAIMQKCFDAGLEQQLKLTQLQRRVLGVRLQQLQLDDERRVLQKHLDELTGLSPETIITASNSIPSTNALHVPEPSRLTIPPESASERSASANLQARQQHAAGDAHFVWRPQVGFAAQYGRVSPINSVSDYYNLHGRYNVGFAGIQMQLPAFDPAHRARVEEAAAETAHSRHELNILKQQYDEDRLHLAHSLEELTVCLEIAELDYSISEMKQNSISLQALQGGGTVARR